MYKIVFVYKVNDVDDVEEQVFQSVPTCLVSQIVNSLLLFKPFVSYFKIGISVI